MSSHPSESEKEHDESYGYEQEDNQTISIKLLFSNQAAGILIGRGGETIRSFQETSGAMVKLAPHNELFPGTVERVALVRGSFDQVLSALSLMWTHLSESSTEMDEFVVVDDGDNEEAVAKLLIPSTLAGLVIGKNGENIRDLRETYNVRLQMSSRDEGLVTVERILRIRAPLDGLMRCIEAVLGIFADNLDFAAYVNPSTHYSKRPENFAPLRRNNTSGGNSSSSSMMGHRRLPDDVTVTVKSLVTIEVPESDIGAVLGKGGAMIAEIQRASGASVVVSQREEFPSSGSHRLVTIEGTEPSAQTAQLLVLRCIQQHQQTRARRQGEMFDYHEEET
jgi:predicted RNA-binding protein YlqC (UPF0109 family)